MNPRFADIYHWGRSTMRDEFHWLPSSSVTWMGTDAIVIYDIFFRASPRKTRLPHSAPRARTQRGL